METNFLLLLLLSVKTVFASNILFVSLMASPSHHIWNRALAVGLSQKGHNVTLIGPDKDKLPKPSNYSHIWTEGLYEALATNFDLNEMATYSPTQMMLEYQSFGLMCCEMGLKSKGLRQLLDYPKDFKFDLVIFDATLGSCFYPLLLRFNYPPSIAVTAFLLPTFLAYNFGNHIQPSYVPWYGLPYSPDMSFVERVWNSVLTFSDANWRKINLYRKEHELAKKVFGEGIPTMEEFERHVSLVLTNTDPVLAYPQPLAPNFIPVGGLHTRPPAKLPQEWQTIMDNAKNGVIVFSLGTNIRSDNLDKRTQRAFLDAFSQLSETVIWKFESEIDDLPKNVIVSKWLPQNDIMGHANVKLFIGHGGTLSTQETIFHGVPMVCVPFIVDQHINKNMLVNRKLGVYLDFQRVTADYVLAQVKEVLHKPVYADNMRKLSRLFKDRTETPLERAIFWTEYVMRHGGAHFLNTPARDLPFYKSSGLDVVAFLALVTAILFLSCYKVVVLILSAFSGRKKVKIN